MAVRPEPQALVDPQESSLDQGYEQELPFLGLPETPRFYEPHQVESDNPAQLVPSQSGGAHSGDAQQEADESASATPSEVQLQGSVAGSAHPDTSGTQSQDDVASSTHPVRACAESAAHPEGVLTRKDKFTVFGYIGFLTIVDIVTMKGITSTKEEIAIAVDLYIVWRAKGDGFTCLY